MRSLSFGFGCLSLALGLTLSAPAMAYIGPGAGITMLGALWGVIVAVLLAVAAVLFWPIRALVRKARGPRPAAGGGVASVAAPSPDPAGAAREKASS